MVLRASRLILVRKVKCLRSMVESSFDPRYETQVQDAVYKLPNRLYRTG